MKSRIRSTNEFTIGMGKLNITVTLVNAVVTILFLLIFKYFWSMEVFYSGKDLIMDYWLEILLAGFIIHGLIEGIIYAHFSERGIQSIQLGYKWRWIAPYCHCTEPLSVRHYKIVAITPLLICGIIPSLLAILIGNAPLLCLGLLFTWFGVGNIIVLSVLRSLDDDSVVFVHPSKVGFIVKRVEGISE